MHAFLITILSNFQHALKIVRKFWKIVSSLIVNMDFALNRDYEIIFNNSIISALNSKNSQDLQKYSIKGRVQL